MTQDKTAAELAREHLARFDKEIERVSPPIAATYVVSETLRDLVGQLEQGDINEAKLCAEALRLHQAYEPKLKRAPHAEVWLAELPFAVGKVLGWAPQDVENLL